MACRVPEALKGLAQLWLSGPLVAPSHQAKVEEAELSSQAESSSKNPLNPNKSILSKYRLGNFLLQESQLLVLRCNVSFFPAEEQ